jgi:hypothetical protein
MRKKKPTHLPDDLPLENDPGFNLDLTSSKVLETTTALDLDPTTNTRLHGDMWRTLMKRIEREIAK